jgi:RNA polymerase sigma-70 factor (ECF subfamily)
LGESRSEILGELFDAHQPRLYRLARRLVGDPDEARDLVQEAFLRLAWHPGIDKVGTERGEAWLVRVLVNLCRDRQRRERVRRSHLVAVSRAGARDETDGAARAIEARATVQAALLRLPARRRAVIVLHELEERDTAEIAKILGLARVTVRWHLHAGRRQLREVLGWKGTDHEA